MSEESGIGTKEFDLTELAIHADHARRARVRLNAAGIGLGVALVVIGAYFLVAPPPGSIPSYSSGPSLFIAIGVVITAVGIWVRLSLGPSPRRLVVSERSLDFADIPGHPNIRLDWTQPGFSLEIRDFRQIRLADPKSRSRGYEFVIHPRSGPQPAVPSEAVEAILRVADSHGMVVTKREVAIGAKAPMTVISIQGPH